MERVSSRSHVGQEIIHGDSGSSHVGNSIEMSCAWQHICVYIYCHGPLSISTYLHMMSLPKWQFYWIFFSQLANMKKVWSSENVLNYKDMPRSLSIKAKLSHLRDTRGFSFFLRGWCCSLDPSLNFNELIFLFILLV